MADAESPDLPLPPPPDDHARRYCLRCRTKLPGRHPLDDEVRGESKCPRCALPYDPARSETYTTRHMRLRWKFWIPWLAAAIIAGVAVYALIWTNGANIGANAAGSALFLAVPFAIGMALGYGTRVSFWMTLLLSLLAIACVVCMLLSLSLTGIFCGLTLGLVFLVPTLVGCVVGWIIRVLTGEAAWDRRKYIVLPAIFVLPLGVEQVESRWPMADTVAEVSTSTTFDVPVGPTWDAIVFYEQVEHEAPFLLTMALPRPARTEGRKEAVGDVQKCIYQKGYLVKTITHFDKPRLLGFDVTEQHLDFEHDVEVLDGSFILQPMAKDKTRVVLTTRYRRLLRPAWLWEPVERTVIHTLHGHVLDGMRRRAGGE